MVQHFKQGPVEVVPRKRVFRLFTLSLLRMGEGVGGGDFKPLKKHLGSVHILHNQRLTNLGPTPLRNQDNHGPEPHIPPKMIL